MSSHTVTYLSLIKFTQVLIWISKCLPSGNAQNFAKMNVQNCFWLDNFLMEYRTGNMQKIVKISGDKNAKVSLEIM